MKQPIPYILLSNTARAGLTGFMKTVAREVAATGVTLELLHQRGFIRLHGHAPDRLVFELGIRPDGTATEVFVNEERLMRVKRLNLQKPILFFMIGLDEM